MSSKSKNKKAREWLTTFAKDNDMTYDDLLGYLARIVEGDYVMVEDGKEVYYDGEFMRDEWYENREELLKCYSRVTGQIFEDYDVGGFTCTC